MIAEVSRDKTPLSVIILTYQEEANLGACLENVCDWAAEVFVVDSFSTDSTVAIAQRYGVPVFQNPFETMAQQRNWALAHLPLKNLWVLFLDADERPTPELKKELSQVFTNFPDEIGGLYTRRRFIWMGRWLKHAGMHKWVMRTVRRDRARVSMAGRREYMRVVGKTLYLQHDLVHDDRKGVGDWISKHNKYALQEAREIMHTASGKPLTEGWGGQDSRQGEGEHLVTMRKYWNRLPLFTRPPLNFLIKYFLMLGFLDGLAGLTYCFLHDLWYPFLVDVKILELRQAESSR